MFRIICLSLFTTVLWGCSSYQNLNEMGDSYLGGGFEDNNIGPGLFEVVAKSNFSLYENFPAAQKTFDRRASELCSGSGYSRFRLKKDTYEHYASLGAAQYLISEISGYVLCSTTSLSTEEAQALITKDAALLRPY